MAKLTDIYKMETAQPVAEMPKKKAAVLPAPAIVGKYNLATAQPVQSPAPVAQAPVQPQQMPKLEFQPVAPTSTGEVPFRAQPEASGMGFAEGGAKSFAKSSADTMAGLTQAGGSAVADVKFGLESAAAQRYLDVVLPMVKDGRIPENEMEGTMADIKRNQAIVDAANKANYERTQTARDAGDVYRGLVSKDTRAELEQWQNESGLPAKVIAGVAEAIPLMAGGAVASAAGSMVAGPAGGLLAGWQAMAGTESANFRNETTDALVGAGIDAGIANQYVRKYANQYGQMSGIVEHLGNALQLSAAKIGPKAAMDALKKTGAFKVLAEKFFGGLSEGAEEAIQTGLSNYLKKKMVEDIMRERGEDVAKSIGKESVLAAGGMGALVGLVLQSLGLPGAVAGAAQNAKADATAIQSAKYEADRLNAPASQALSELEKTPTEAILGDLEASGEAEHVTAQDLVNMGIPEAEAKSYMQNRIAQGKTTNISGIGQENLVPQEEAKPPLVPQPAPAEQPIVPAPAPEPPQAGIQAPPATVAGTSPSENAVTGTEEKGGATPTVFTNDETGEQVSGTVVKETKKSVVVQDENGNKRTLLKDQWAGEASEPVVKESLTGEPAPRSDVPAKTDRPVVEKKSKLKTGQKWRELAGEEANDPKQVTKARTLLDVIGTKPIMESTGLQATEYDRDAAAGEPTRKWYSAGSYYPEGWNKQKMAKLKNALRDLDAGKPMRLDQVQLIDEAARTVDSDPKLRQHDGPETAEDFVEAEKLSNRGDKLPVSESDMETGDLVFKDGEWYRAENTPDGTTLVDGKEVDLNHSQEVGVGALFKTTDGETYNVALQQYREQEAKKASKKDVTKAVSPSGQAEFIGQDEGGFQLVGETVKQKAPKKTQDDLQNQMFSTSETRGRALDELDAKGPTELKRIAEREGVDLEFVKPDAASIRTAIRSQRNAKPAPQDIEGEGKKEKKGGFLSLPGGVWANRLINSIKATIRESSERADAYFSKARQMDRADSIRQKQNAFRLELQAIRKRLVKAKFNDNDVFEDLNRTVGETEYVLGNETFAKDDLERMDVDELKVIAKQNKIKVPFTREQYLDAIKKGSYYDKANKIYRLGNDQYTLQQLNGMSDADLQQLASDKKLYPKRTRQDFVDAIIGAATFDRMTPAQFSRKYNLTASETKILVDLVTEAQSLSKDVESLTLGAGLEVSGDFIGQNDLYSRRKYLRNILGWKFKPTAGARTDALIAADEVISESVERIGTLATKLNKRSGGTSDVGMFLQTGNRQYLTGLDSESRQMAQNIKSMYDSFGDLVIAGISSNNGVVDIATHIDGIRQTSESLIEEMIHGQPTNKNNTGMGSVADALLHRQLDRIWRNLFGEIKDPAFRYAMSREAQMNTVNRMTFLNELASKSGLFSDTKIDGESLGHTVRLGSSQKMNATVSMSDRAKFGVLAGKYTSPEVAKIIAGENAFAGGDVVILGPLWSAAKRFGGVMRGNMILRPAALVRDALTGMWGFATLAGDYGTRYAANHAKITKDVYAFIAAHARNDKLSEAKYRRMWAKYAELGVSRMGASTSLEGVEGALNLKNPIGRAWERALKIRTMLTDHITKIAGYETYLNNLKKWYKSELRAGTITTEQLETMAADHIRFVYDNRDAMPQWIKKISRNPLVTDYVTFKYSSTRSVINSMREIAVLAQDPHIPKTYIAGRLAKFAAGVLTLGLVAGAELKIAGDAEDELEKLIEKITGLKVRGFGKRIRSKIRTSIATIPAKMSGSDVGSLSETTEDIEKAVRYIGEDYYRNDNQSIFLDDKGNMVRIVWTGSISPFALAVDLPTGFMDAGAIEGINPMDYLKSMRDDVIGGKTMFFDMAETLGKNLSEAYRNSIASSEDVALNQAYDERASDAMQKALIDLANDVFGYYSKVLTSSKTIENYNEWIENKFTEPIEKNGQVVSVPKGYGSKPGLPLDMYKSSRNINNIFMQGIIPVSVRIYTQNDIRQNISLRASAIYKLSSTLNDAQKDVRRNMTSAEKRRYDTMLLDKEVRGWVEHSAVLLRGIGINNVRETQIDALAKAGFKDWQIEHIMKIRR
jgi:hypothetical protein